MNSQTLIILLNGQCRREFFVTLLIMGKAERVETWIPAARPENDHDPQPMRLIWTETFLKAKESGIVGQLFSGWFF